MMWNSNNQVETAFSSSVDEATLSKLSNKINSWCVFLADFFLFPNTSRRQYVRLFDLGYGIM